MARTLINEAKMRKAKDVLMIICVLSFIWLVLFGDLMQINPSPTTFVVLSICSTSFFILLLLRLASLFGMGRGEK
jgi:uncharacterized membrane protein